MTKRVWGEDCGLDGPAAMVPSRGLVARLTEHSSRMLTRVIRPLRRPRRTAWASRPDEPIVHLRRLRQADDQPIALESSVLIGLCAETVMAADLADGSLHEALGRAGIPRRGGSAPSPAPPRRPDDARLLASASAIRSWSSDGSSRTVWPTHRGDRVALRRRPLRPPGRVRCRGAGPRGRRSGRPARPSGASHDRRAGRQVHHRPPGPRRSGCRRPDPIGDGRIAAVDLDPGESAAPSRSSPRATSTSTSTAGAATTRWATTRPSTAWPGRCFGWALPRSCRPPCPRPSPRSPRSPNASGVAARRSRRRRGSRSASTSRGRSSRLRQRGAHDLASLPLPTNAARPDLEPLLDGLRLMTIAPELPERWTSSAGSGHGVAARSATRRRRRDARAGLRGRARPGRPTCSTR